MMLTTAPKPWFILLTLGRVSNLPTIWTNVLAASLFTQVMLGQGGNFFNALLLSRGLFVLLGMSLMYLGGMFLNDAIDAKWDRAHQVARPITQAWISQRAVYLFSYFLLLSGMLLLTLVGWVYLATFDGLNAGLSLFLLILLYNLFHKTWVYSRLLMGGCRAGMYLTAGLLMGGISGELIWVSMGLGLYIVGITLLAQFEHQAALFSYRYGVLLLLVLLLLFSPLYLVFFIPLNPLFYLILSGFLLELFRQLFPLIRGFISHKSLLIQPSDIGALLAMIPLFDALVLASVQQFWACIVCLCVYILLPKLQRWISPT
ncbi:hypothetical protein [Shewanella surugensis]|uniref:Prenyltransferase n=1 Tax=Shewanella surugensis TaxID=212020 RepID=A0ABT0LHW4_9GAMM|nr:hypothetical protein [Shewanella surugensis]MCL1126897.1 hypothetical protein [Shewanella surugensis]